MFLEQYKDEVDAFIWFDSDMIFPDNTIATLIAAHKSSETKYCIITPQIHRLWDETWDILVNKDYMNIPASHDNYKGFDGYSLYKRNDKEIFLDTNIKNFKFASGWCNLLSANLFKDYVNFDYSLGHYGPDDTFIMHLLDYYKFNKGKDINQYFIENLVVTENYKHNLNQYKDYITKNKNILTKDEFAENTKIACHNAYIKITNE
tara:strand:- start:368 stop:982 length:615 start_codon:yes stop_codon:yes gene_type:complete